jgi:hypothetical protein
MTTTPDTETEVPQTPEQLLTELAQLHIRTIVPPSPKQPAAHGWQAIAGCQAAGFARALHALMEVAPEKAAEITDWYQGPFEEGPDPEEHTDWIERTVAKNVDVLDEWITQARDLAVQSAKATAAHEAGEVERDAIHKHFGLSYASYLVLSRTLLQSMPDLWQTEFVALLDVLYEAFRHVPQAEAYEVTAGTEHIVNELGFDLLEEAGITEDWYGEEVPTDLSPEDLAGWKADHEKDAPTYYDRDGRELDPNERVFLPAADPVPHYDRGRTRIEPRLDGGQ